ncbi:queuine tRNA-ribosyltransferase [Arthrobacter phage Mufasa8]|uniref:Queuine tRNA-ribosyltransferase n=1 Tax=Arthrobacter phage Mufasa8 TaxID=2656526 RepID=A0A649VMB0_9CAUD|nr:queuine tRNA-ribosyltransferase [Arthrobacter phage Mufasa8]QGJ93537.1 queuine tRNA-ribosyltransferase [Arthrobacter phage Mufasa8]
MKIFAALSGNTRAMRVISEEEYPNLLCSFAYKSCLPKAKFTPPFLHLDSGAFTAWSRGKQVAITDYADWAIEQNGRSPHIEAVNLDVIPGEFGRTSTPEERKAGMRQSLRNADYLRSRGISIAEVFHQDEPLSFLDELLDRLPEGGLLCISPRNDKPLPSKLAWQKHVLSHLMKRYTPATLPRMHGLAVTSAAMLREFPYYSGDSSTWCAPVSFGRFVDTNGSTNTIAGRLTPTRVGRADTNTHEAIAYALRLGLSNLQRLERDITTLWAKRGVTFD